MIECERFKTNAQKMQQKTATNILLFGKCLWLRHCKHLYSWARITQTFGIPSKVQERISQWNRCLTYLKSWWPDNQMRSMEWIQLTGKIFHGNNYLWLMMKKSSVSRTRRFTYFSDSVACLEKVNQNPQSNTVWEDKLKFRIQNFGHNWWWANGIRLEYFPGFTTLQLCNKVLEFMSKMSDKPEEFQGRIIFMSMFNDIIWRSTDNERECDANADFVSILAKRFTPGRWSFFGPGSEKKWYSTYDSRPQREWDRVPQLMMIQFAESGHPVFRATSRLSRGTFKSRGCVKLSIHFCADRERLKLFFAQLFLSISSVSTEQSQICVKNTKLAM